MSTFNSVQVWKAGLVIFPRQTILLFSESLGGQYRFGVKDALTYVGLEIINGKSYRKFTGPDKCHYLALDDQLLRHQFSVDERSIPLNRPAPAHRPVVAVPRPPRGGMLMAAYESLKEDQQHYGHSPRR